MPKTFITKQEKLNNDLAVWLTGEMKVQQKKQVEVASALGISQQALSNKIRTKSFKYEDLVALFEIFQPEAETIVRLMGASKQEV